MTAPGAVIFVVGALFLLIAIAGGGLEVRELKIPTIPRGPRIASAGAGVLCWIIGVWLLIVPTVRDNGNQIPSLSPTIAPTSTPPPLSSTPLQEIFPGVGDGKAFVFTNNHGILQDAYRREADCHRRDRPVGLRLKWDMSAAGEPYGSWGVQWEESPSHSFDASQFTSFVISVKGVQGGEAFQIGLRDRDGNEVKIESMEEVLVDQEGWSRLKVMLTDFVGVNLAAVANVSFGFNKKYGAGQVCIDEIDFFSSY